MIVSQQLGKIQGDASRKEPAWQCKKFKRHGFEPCVRNIPWRRARQPHPGEFLPGESHGQRAWRATVHRVTKSQTRLKRLSMHTRMIISQELDHFGATHKCSTAKINCWRFNAPRTKGSGSEGERQTAIQLPVVLACSLYELDGLVTLDKKILKLSS